MTESTLAHAALWSYGIAAAGFAAFALRLVVGGRHSTNAKLLLAAAVVSALWAGMGIATVTAASPRVWAVAVACDIARYAAWFAFIVSVLRGSREGAAPGPVLSAVPGWFAFTAVAALTAGLLLPGTPPFVPNPEGPVRSVGFGAHLALAVIGLVIVEQLIRRADAQARWALRPLCVGLAGIFAFDLFLYANAMMLGRLSPDIWVARGLANALVIPLLALATARNPGWAIDMHMSRGVVFHSTALLVSSVFLLLVAAAGYFVRYVGGSWGDAIAIVLAFAALLTVAFVGSSGRFRAQVRVFVSKHFFSYRYDYREEWLRFTRMLSTEGSLHGVQERTVLALAGLVESPGGALWLQQDQVFRQVARCNMATVTALEPADGALAAFLARTGWVIDLKEYAARPDRYAGLELPAWLTALPQAWIVVPLVSGSELVGFAVLLNPRVAIEVNWEVLDLLKTASRQAASFLGHVGAAEALLEARKFDAFNRMSAFVVHDLKNLVAQLSLMLKNAERHRDNPEFQRDMLATVEHVVGRMYNLMLQLRTGAAPAEQPRATDLEAVVRRVCAAKAGQRAAIALDLAPGLAVAGHADRFDHVIGHLVQNALDATADSGTVSVRLAREGGNVVLEVADTGVGMTPEFVRERLFKPFETSKPGGMGIGVYESSQYVTALGGQVLVDSTPRVGTRVRVVLPAAGSATDDAPARSAGVAA